MAQNRVDIEPRGMRRPEAATYLGVSLRTFDGLVRGGKVPPPVETYGIRVWDRRRLDSLFIG